MNVMKELNMLSSQDFKILQTCKEKKVLSSFMKASTKNVA
jgi:hypothetical protein